MSLRRMAREAGLSYSYVKEVAAGRVQPRDHNAQKFATVLGCTVEDFSTPRPDTATGSAA
jgi:transcriptional regulator with XRE-family HTH domain